MKILIVNFSDLDGGAARAAYRLHQALLSAKVDSQMLVLQKISDDYRVRTVYGKIMNKFIGLKIALNNIFIKRYKNDNQNFFSHNFLPSVEIIQKINEIKPDIVHLHWICGGMMRIKNLQKIQAPLVWTLHDMWAFTGGCHYDSDCKKYLNNCGECPVLGSQKKNDLSRNIFFAKDKTYRQLKNLTIIGLSKWLCDCSKKSNLLRSKKHIILPNPINIEIFKPFNKEEARTLWNLPQKKKIVLFGAINSLVDRRKGFEKLSKALEELKKSYDDEPELVIFGSSEPKNPPNFGFRTHYLGHLHDDVSLMTLYSSADVMIVPSIQENLSNAIMESLSCGTPVIAFNIGGNKDLINHRENGYLAKPFEPSDLAEGIRWVLNHPDYKQLCQNARNKIVENFDSKLIAKKYIELYQEILNNENS